MWKQCYTFVNIPKGTMMRRHVGSERTYYIVLTRPEDYRGTLLMWSLELQRPITWSALARQSFDVLS
jgi:hypothetical protein